MNIEKQMNEERERAEQMDIVVECNKRSVIEKIRKRITMLEQANKDLDYNGNTAMINRIIINELKELL